VREINKCGTEMNVSLTEGERNFKPGSAVNKVRDSGSKCINFILAGLCTAAEALQRHVN
jgi:hypothetical protein